MIRIGLANVKTGAVGEGVNAAELSAAVQNTLAEYLKTPNVETVRLDAKLPSAIDAESKEKECDFVIYAQISHRKGGGLFGKALGKLSEHVSHNAYDSSDHVGEATQITIMTAAAASGNVKAKDQVTLEIKLVALSPVADAPKVLNGSTAIDSFAIVKNDAAEFAADFSNSGAYDSAVTGRFSRKQLLSAAGSAATFGWLSAAKICRS